MPTVDMYDCRPQEEESERSMRRMWRRGNYDSLGERGTWNRAG